MFSGQSEHARSLANLALLTSLIRTLVSENILTERMAEGVYRYGIKLLKPSAASITAAEAIQFIEMTMASEPWRSEAAIA